MELGLPESAKNSKMNPKAFARNEQFTQTRAAAFNLKILMAGATCKWVSTSGSCFKAQKCGYPNYETQKSRTRVSKM